MHKNIRLLAWFNFMLDFRLYAPIAILYFADVSGSFALGMSVFSTAMLASALFEVPTGVFSDMIGRKRTVVVGAAASVLSIVFYAIGGTYPVLLVGAVFEGLARSFFSGNNDALLYDTLAETDQQAQYQEYLGKTSSMYQVALAIAAVIGGVIAYFSFSATMWLSVIPQVIGLLISTQFVNPAVHTRESTNVYAHLREAFRNILRNRRLRSLSAGSILGFAVGESVWLFRSAFIETLWPVWALGISQLIGNATAAISFYFSGRLIRRFGEFRLLATGITSSRVVHVFAMIVPSVLSPVLMSVMSIFFGVNTVGINGLMQREFTTEQRATMGSLNSFGGNLAFAVCSFLLGLLADTIGVIEALVLGEIILMAPLWFYWKAFREKGDEAAGEIIPADTSPIA